jgi:hypothetical protein
MSGSVGRTTASDAGRTPGEIFLAWGTGAASVSLIGFAPWWKRSSIDRMNARFLSASGVNFALIFGVGFRRSAAR